MPDIATVSKPGASATTKPLFGLSADQQSNPPPPPPPPQSLSSTNWANRLPWGIPLALATVCVVAYFCFVQTLVDFRAADALTWERLISIFRSVEAIGYAAIGTVLGVALQAPRIQAAAATANAAQQDAAKHKARADSLERNIERIRQLQNVVNERSSQASPLDSARVRLDEAIQNGTQR